MEKKRINLKRSDKTKERDFEILEAANCRKANMWGNKQYRRTSP